MPSGAKPAGARRSVTPRITLGTPVNTTSTTMPATMEYPPGEPSCRSQTGSCLRARSRGRRRRSEQHAGGAMARHHLHDDVGQHLAL